ncbi:MAG: metallophosphoesterase family protein [Jatrophihabitans sp.]
MVASVAVLSDIHGVLPALEAVLAEPDVQAAERIVLTGDIAAGPMPVQTLDRLIGLADQVVWVRGNADRELADLARGGSTSIPDPIAPWAAGQLTPEHVELLGTLPHPVTLDVDGFGAVVFCHGTPRDDEEILFVESTAERWITAFDGLADEVTTVVCGHTHMPFSRLVERRLVINPGSVGMPYGRAGAHWALLHDGEARLRRTDFDRPTAIAELTARSSYPDIAEWTDYFLHSRASDLEALVAFRPREGGLPRPPIEA